MNDEIKQLRKQALDWVQHNLETVERDHAVMEHEQLEMVNEKFAELIVKECAELSVNSQYVNTKSEYYEGFNEALIYAGNKIKKHFGVEE